VKIAVITLGCRANQAESGVIEEKLRARGHTTGADLEDADIVIINSCSVTASADRQSRQLVKRALRADARVILTGCYAELNKERIPELGPHITVIGNSGKSGIPDLIPMAADCIPGKASVRRHRPIIKIQDGCNNACSYCVIPLARGGSRSVLPADVVSEVSRYEGLGFDEVVLSGIHIGLYGHDLEPSTNLEQLLTKIIRETGISRVRLSSIEISEVTEGILDIMSSGRICRHLHIPLQGGTDNLLINMRRSYNLDMFRRVLDRILEKIENIALGTDVIIGFPGEDHEEFRRSLFNISDMPFSYMHVFPFSGRPGTPAYKMAGHVSGLDKKDRVRQMLSIASDKKERFILKNVGLQHEMVIENIASGITTGSTSNYIKVFINSEIDARPGRLIKTAIAEGRRDHAIGIALKSS
jgi:threonylcarbamoyladenosine tRNA methylthiotransferase MtaB